MDSEASSAILLTSHNNNAVELQPIEASHRPDVPVESTTSSQADVATSEPDSTTTVQQLPPVDGGWNAWMFCLAGLVNETLVWGLGFSYGIFQGYYTSHPPFDQAPRLIVSAVGPATIALQYMMGLPLSFFYNRYPDFINASMWLGLAMGVASLVISSFVTNVWMLLLFQGVGLGVAGSMLYWPVMLYVSDWFVQRRGLAGGIIFAGSGIGGFLLPFLISALLDKVGFKWTLRYLALIQGVLGGLSLLGIKPRIPHLRYRNGQRRPRFIPPRIQFLKRRMFWSYSVTNFLQAMSYFPVSLYIAVFTTTISSPLSATIVLAMFNIAGVAGQILIGYLSDRFPYPWIMFASAMGSAIAAFLLWGFANNLATVLAFSIVFGALGGGFSSVAFAAATDSSAPNAEQATMAQTAFTVVKGVAAIIGPIISGLLLEAGKTVSHGPFGKFGFGPVELFVGSCALACSFSSLAVVATRPRLQ